MVEPELEVGGVLLQICGLRYRLKGDLQWQYVSLENARHIDKSIHEVEGLLSAVDVSTRLSETEVAG